jgi:hypothetical protein
MNIDLISKLSSESYDKAVEMSKTEKHKCVIGSDYFNALEKTIYTQLLVNTCADVAFKKSSNPMEDYDTARSLYAVGEEIKRLVLTKPVL